LTAVNAAGAAVGGAVSPECGGGGAMATITTPTTTKIGSAE